MQDPPRLCRLAIRLASWVVPAARRRQWRDRREYEAWNWWGLLAERGELTPRRRQEIRRFCLASFPEAVWARFDREETATRARRLYRGPIMALAAPLLLMAIIVVASGGLRGVRSFFRPLPYPSPEQLVVVSQERSMGNPQSVQQHAFAVWTEKAQSLQGIAGFLRRRQRVSGRRDRLIAAVTPNLFSVLGVRPKLGRTLRDGDLPDVAVATYWYWQGVLHADPRVVGTTIDIDGKPVKIVGVLTRRFPVLGEATVFTPMEIDLPWRRHLIGAIARLRPGATIAGAEREMLALLKTEGVRYFQPPRLTPFQARRLTPLLWYGIGLVFAIAIGAGMVQVRKPSFAVSHAQRSRLRYWAFFAAKTALLLAAVALAWVEVAEGIQFRFDSAVVRELIGGVLATVAFVIAGACAVYWSFYDQRSRCPECLQRLTLPVTIGSWSSPLLDPVTTEMVCERGHGALCFPETQSSASERERWTALDESWKELFTK